MKINKTLITTALACCLTSGITLAQEQNDLEVKALGQFESHAMFESPKSIFIPDPSDPGDPPPLCPAHPNC